MENRSQALAALGAGTGIIIGTKLALTDDFRMLKAQNQAIVDGLTTAEGEGLLLGLADGDLSIAEIEEAIEANGPVDANDVVIGNTAMRPVWILGVLRKETAALWGRFFDAVTGAPSVTAKPRWTFSSTKSWNWFVYNQGIALQAGSSAKMTSKTWGVWVR